jgi:hypothetical protein
MFLLVKGLLEDERESFPQTLASFEQESRTVLEGAPRDRKGLLKLQDVLDEYLSLKAERQARADLTEAFRRDPSAGHPVTTVFENLMVFSLAQSPSCESNNLAGLCLVSDALSCGAGPVR